MNLPSPWEDPSPPPPPSLTKKINPIDIAFQIFHKGIYQQRRKKKSENKYGVSRRQ